MHQLSAHDSLVSRFLAALEGRDLDAAIECLDEEVYFVSAAGTDFGTSEGFRRWWDLQISNGCDFHILGIEALDDRRVFAEVLAGHAEHGGAAWSTETVGCFYTVGKETIEVIEMFADPAGALTRARHAIEVLGSGGPLGDS